MRPEPLARSVPPVQRGLSLPLSLPGAPLAWAARELEETARLILEVRPGERPLEREFGCRFHRLARIETREERELAAALAEEALERWAPRLGIERVDVAGAGGGELRLVLWRRGVRHEVAVSHRPGGERAVMPAPHTPEHREDVAHGGARW